MNDDNDDDDDDDCRSQVDDDAAAAAVGELEADLDLCDARNCIHYPTSYILGSTSGTTRYDGSAPLLEYADP